MLIKITGGKVYDPAHGVDGVHLYTMNHPCVSRRIWSNVKPFFV